MIVKDEAARLEACLASAAPVVEEVVVVDTGSTDDTRALAARLGARVSTFDFRQPDFAGARNHSLDQATGAWILVLDADETLDDAAPDVIRALTRHPENTGYVVTRRNARPRPLPDTTDHAVRLFPNHPKHRYRGRVHETVDAAILSNGGRIRTSHVTIRHQPAGDAGRTLEKSRFYLSILEQELALAPDDVDRLNFRRAELHTLGALDEAARTAERIAVLAPDDPAHHVQVGLYRLHARDSAGAEQAFRRALTLRPGDERAIACLRSIERSVKA